jgi:ubiquinone/menaquinone biosynthesis C-methylase UbiE
VFGQVAEVYGRARPGYPAPAVEWLVGRPSQRVLDLGAGTGKLTAALVAAGHDVVAVDPSTQMLAILRATVPAAQAVAGLAESIPLPDASVDTVVVGQAFNWFDHAAAVPELSRVLRSGGRLGLVWNIRDETTPWVAELSRVIGGKDASGLTPSGQAALTHFDSFEEAQFRHAQQLDRDTLLGLVKSRSYVAIRPAAEQDEICAEVAQLYDRYADSTGLTLPYVTRCYRAHRRSFRVAPVG